MIGRVSRDRELRRPERLPILGDLRADLLVAQPLLVRDLGPLGATIDTAFPLPLDSIHDLRLPLHDHVAVLKARVVHSHIEEVERDVVTYRSGVEFVSVPPHVADAIEAYVALLKSQRVGT